MVEGKTFSSASGPSTWTYNQIDRRQIKRRKSNLIGVCKRNPRRHSNDNEATECLQELRRRGRGSSIQRGKKFIRKKVKRDVWETRLLHYADNYFMVCGCVSVNTFLPVASSPM